MNELKINTNHNLCDNYDKICDYLKSVFEIKENKKEEFECEIKELAYEITRFISRVVSDGYKTNSLNQHKQSRVTIENDYIMAITDCGNCDWSIIVNKETDEKEIKRIIRQAKKNLTCFTKGE